MIRIRFSLVFIFLWIGLTACEHKDLCYDHPHFATVRVIFDWTKISNHDKPEGMRVVFYPTDDESNTWIFDFPGGEDGEVELPENDYRVICFNYIPTGWFGKKTAVTRFLLPIRVMCSRRITGQWLSPHLGCVATI